MNYLATEFKRQKLRQKLKMNKSKVGRGLWKGFTLIEMLIVVTIILILMLIIFTSLRVHLSRSHDAERKGDLEMIKVAFEDYYNDFSCYPAVGVLENCGAEWGQYIKEIPCDPATGEPYVHFTLDNDACAGYRILTQLETDSDPVIEEIGCGADYGCWMDGDEIYNYGVAVGADIVDGAWTGQGPGSPVYAWYLTYYTSPERYECELKHMDLARAAGCFNGLHQEDCLDYAAECNGGGCSPEGEAAVCDLN